MANKPTVTIIIPAYNEEETIGTVIQEIKQAMSGLQYDYEVIVVNDGSKDNTREIAKKLSVNIISFAGNRGLVSAFNTGVRHASSRNADIIVNIDGDGQHDPKDIKKIISPILENKADMVIGARFLGEYKHPSFIKHFGNKTFSFVISKLTHQRITDAQSGFRAFTREVAESIEIKKGFTYTQQMVIQAAYHNLKIVEVPIEVKSRKHGKSKLMKNPFSFAYNAGGLLLQILAIYYPLKFFGILGIMLAALGATIGFAFPAKNVLSSLIIATGIQCVLFGVLFEIVRKR